MPSTGMEVRYEDFKISELLDIKMKRGKASKKTGEKPERSEARKGSNFNKSGSEERSPSVTKLFVLIAFMIVLASLIACFLLR